MNVLGACRVDPKLFEVGVIENILFRRRINQHLMTMQPEMVVLVEKLADLQLHLAAYLVVAVIDKPPLILFGGVAQIGLYRYCPFVDSSHEDIIKQGRDWMILLRQQLLQLMQHPANFDYFSRYA